MDAARPRILLVGPAADGRGGISTVTRLTLDELADRAEIRLVVSFRDGSLLVRLATFARAIIPTVWAMAGGWADVLHVQLSFGGSVLRKGTFLLCARVFGVATVVHAHGSSFVQWYDRLPTVWQRLVRRVLRADRVLVLGAPQEAAYQQRLRLEPGRLVLLPNPVQVPTGPRVRRSSDPGRTVVVFLGRFGERKGAFDLIASVEALPEPAASRVRVVMAGDGAVDQVRQAVLDAGLDSVISVRTWLDPAERDALLAEGDVFALPSYEEGLPMALLESMAWGLAPVVTPVGAIADLIRDGENGLLVPPGDRAAMTAALQRLTEDSDLVRGLGEQAGRTARDFAADIWAGRLLAIWQELADLSRRPRRRRR
ncbi:MAG TPA: glycosyltransferase family 4 protein [Mycobacteriales bacterium]|nr:glycosyltransferase family 4 protein [Mycobacteriales bacterium]